jgi:DNA-binding CsgD family transcriptional regulator
MRFKDSRLAALLDVDIKRAMEAFPLIWMPPSGRGPHYLTDAEMGVLRLVGLGMTNKEIAAHLFISPMTARTHVKRAHAKCGVPGRARLAVTAFMIWDRGLWTVPEKRKEALAEEKARKRQALAEMAA